MDERPIEALKETVVSHVEQLEASRRLGVPVATTRRFFEIEGLDLGGLLALELFTTVIPLILIGFGWFSGFSNSLSFGDLLIRQLEPASGLIERLPIYRTWSRPSCVINLSRGGPLELQGDGSSQVRGLFGTTASLKSTWTVVGLASFLVWGHSHVVTGRQDIRPRLAPRTLCLPWGGVARRVMVSSCSWARRSQRLHLTPFVCRVCLACCSMCSRSSQRSFCGRQHRRCLCATAPTAGST